MPSEYQSPESRTRPSKVLIRTRSLQGVRWKGPEGRIVLRQISFDTGFLSAL